MKKIIIAVLFVFGLVACSKPTPTPDPALLAAQTEIASAKDDISQLQLQLGEKDATLVYVVGQYHWLQSATPVTVIKEITPAFTATPKFTPTITNTPAPTNTPSPTVDPLKKAKGDGFYLIGVDIAPGVWRSDGKGDRCYWAVTRSDGDIIDNHFGMAGGTAYISPNGFQVLFEECGKWTFMQDP